MLKFADDFTWPESVVPTTVALLRLKELLSVSRLVTETVLAILAIDRKDREDCCAFSNCDILVLELKGSFRLKRCVLTLRCDPSRWYVRSDKLDAKTMKLMPERVDPKRPSLRDETALPKFRTSRTDTPSHFLKEIVQLPNVEARNPKRVVFRTLNHEPARHVSNTEKRFPVSKL